MSVTTTTTTTPTTSEKERAREKLRDGEMKRDSGVVIHDFPKANNQTREFFRRRNNDKYRAVTERDSRSK